MSSPVFTQVALVTSLGHDAVTAAAAARAGLVRPAPLLTHVEDATTKDPMPVSGHPVDGLANGFDGPGRLLRLAELGLHDLLSTTSAETLRSAQWLVACPESLPVAPPPDLSDLDAPPAPPPELAPPRLAPDRLRALIERATGSPLSPTRFSTFEGRAGVIRALGHAQRLCERGDTCVVGAVDSLVGHDEVQTLHAHGRLLSGSVGVGLEPGEAAAFVVMTPEGQSPVLARPGPGALGHESDHLYSGRPPLGRGLAEAANQLPPLDAVWPVSDCNGETFRSSEWGSAAVQNETLRASIEYTLYPAIAVGDTGAAGPAVGLVLVLRAFARGYAPLPSALLIASDALGARGLMVVHAP